MAGRLGNILVARGDISEEQLQVALASQSGQSGMLGELLLAREWITTEQ
ncbi:MAG: pilus assembly protein PilB, partial [Leptolyngbya sp. RL_3_1]|nr:pilus assembly protein PilB [Leptolyngbya sp. RL_3_1]